MWERVINSLVLECFTFLCMVKVRFCIFEYIVCALWMLHHLVLGFTDCRSLLLFSNSEGVYQTGLESVWWPLDMCNIMLSFGGHVHLVHVIFQFNYLVVFLFCK